MKNAMRVFLSTAALAVSLNAMAAQVPGPVVDDAWLAEHKGEVVILDIGNDGKSYVATPGFETDKKTGKKTLVQAGGHIPGAVLVDFDAIRTDRKIGGRTVRFMIPEKAAFEGLARGWGVNRDSAIVIVPMGKNSMDVDEATRLYWQFKYYGEDNVAILNGGLVSWLSSGQPFAVGTSVAPAKGNWAAKAERAELMATSEEVAAAAAKHGEQLVDARDMAQYYGLSKRDVVSAFGHIPGAKDYPPELVSQPGSAKFLPSARYREMLAAQGIDPARPVIAYCNTGHLASGVWFVMSEIVGDKSAKLYDGSMHEWTLEGRPVATGQ